jgi:hypothetical protein
MGYDKDTPQDRVVYEAVLSSIAHMHPVASSSFRQVSSTTFTPSASIQSDRKSNNKYG